MKKKINDELPKEDEKEHPDCGDNNEPSEEIKAKMAELVELICADYLVTNCHEVVKRKVKITDADKWQWEWVEDEKDIA